MGRGLSRLRRQKFFVIFRYISTKLCDKVCISLFNSCVNLREKFARVAEISRQTSQGYFLCSPCMLQPAVPNAVAFLTSFDCILGGGASPEIIDRGRC